MGINYGDCISKLSEYLVQYSGYTTDEKLSVMNDIICLIESISKSPAFKIIDLEQASSLRDACTKLDCALGLIHIDILLSENWRYNRASKTYLQEEAAVHIPELIKRSFLPYVTVGLTHQLSIGRRLSIRPDDLGNKYLSGNYHRVFTDIIDSAIWLESELKEVGIEAHLIKAACKDFTPEQIGFIYAQLADFDRDESSSDETAREELYQAMKDKNNEDKKAFIRTICLLGYCNTAEGIFAMMMDMFDVCGNEGICQMMYEFIADNGEWKYGISDNDLLFIPQANEAYKLRKQDASEKKEPRTVKRYMNDAYANIQKRRGQYHGSSTT